LRLLKATFAPLVLSLADQQMVTGLAILIAALRDWDNISAYHFNLVVYIAWFSSFTHSIALISITEILVKNMMLLVLRSIGFTAVFALYIFAQARNRTFEIIGIPYFVFLLTDGQGQYPGAVAACLAKCCAAQQSSTVVKKSQVMALVVCFILGVVCWLGGLVIHSLEDTEKKDLAFCTCAFLKILMVALAIVLLISGSVGAFILRDLDNYDGLVVAENFGDQNAWSFGQLVAVILLILPLLAAMEGFLGNYSP
jgi:hypothetical protein